jgi:hypothetical protein
MTPASLAAALRACADGRSIRCWRARGHAAQPECRCETLPLRFECKKKPRAHRMGRRAPGSSTVSARRLPPFTKLRQVPWS